MSTPVSFASYNNALSDISDDSSDDEPLATKCIKKQVETRVSPRNGIFDILKSGTESIDNNSTKNVKDDSLNTVNKEVDNELDTIGNEVNGNVDDCVSKDLPTSFALEIKSEKSCDVSVSADPKKSTNTFPLDVQICAEQNSEGLQKGNEKSEESSECQTDSALSTDKLEVNDSSQLMNSSLVEEASGNITSHRSERKAKSFARIRLVLAHEQIVDDDNFLGFTNTKTYRPPKKKKVLCPFKAEKNYVKPKTVQKSTIKVQKETKTLTKEVPKETKTVKKVTIVKQKDQKAVTKIRQKDEKTIKKIKQTGEQRVTKVTNQTQNVTKKVQKITKTTQKVLKTVQKVTKTLQKATVLKQTKKLKSKTKPNTGVDNNKCTPIITAEESLPKTQTEAVPPASTGAEDTNIIVKPKLKIKTELFSCRKCNYKTRNKYYIKRHQMTHDRPRISYECHYCDFVTRSLIVYKEHEARHTKAKPFKCLHCEYCSRSHTDFQRHQAKHSTEKKFKCPLCDFTTKWSRNVRHHILRHNTARPHKCHICGFSFKRMQDLKYHLYRHTDLKPISCDTCDFKCKTNYELRCHKLKHSDERFFSCLYPGCTQQTKTRSDLTKHMNIHNTVKNFICDVCQKAFNTKSCLAKHVRIHGEREPLRCDICQKLLKTRGSLHSHLKIHQGIYPFECDICLKKFSVKYNLIKHQETHMLNDRPYRCPICPHGARVMEHLLAHIGSMHGKSYAYFCEICRKPFKRYGQLKTHMGRMHSTSLDKTTVPAMQSMLREMNTNTEINLKHELNDDTLEFVQVKQEPLELYPGDITEVSLESIKSEPVDTSQPLSAALGTAHDLANNELNLEALIPASVSTIDETSKSTITSDILEDKPLATVGIYNGVTLPLATKGFEFNLEKRGKKPKSWFMNPKHMDRKAAAKHKKYLHKKEQGLIPPKKAKLPINKMERETERMQRRLQKYITSCSLSTKNETTLIFHTDKNHSEVEAKKKKTTWLPRKNTVAALLLESKSTIVSDEPGNTPKLSSEKIGENTTSKGTKRKITSVKKPAAKKIRVLKSTKNSDIAKSTNVATGVTSSVIGVSNGEQLTDETTGLEKEVKKKRGRPKGAKNKKASTETSANTLLQVNPNSSMSPSCLAVTQNIQENPSKETKTALVESVDVLESPVPIVGIQGGTINGSDFTEVSPGAINLEIETGALKTKVLLGKTATGKKRGCKGAENISCASKVLKVKSEIETSDLPKKKKAGRPKGSLNKKKTATKDLGDLAGNLTNQNISFSVIDSESANVSSASTENIHEDTENNESLTNVTNIQTEEHLILRPCSVTLENLTTKRIKSEPFLETYNEGNNISETVSSESPDTLTNGVTEDNGVGMISTPRVKKSVKKTRKPYKSESKNKKQINFSADSAEEESDDNMILSQMKQFTKRKSILDISDNSKENQIVSEELIQDGVTNQSDGKTTLSTVKKSKSKKPRLDKVETSNQNQIVSLEFADSHIDSVPAETIDHVISSKLNHSPKKKRKCGKPGPKKRKCGIPGPKERKYDIHVEGTLNDSQIVTSEIIQDLQTGNGTIETNQKMIPSIGKEYHSVTTENIDKMISSPVNHSPKKKKCGKPGPKKRKCGIPGPKKRKHDKPGISNGSQIVTSESMQGLQTGNETIETVKKFIPSLGKKYTRELTKPSILSETESQTILEISQDPGMGTVSTETGDKIVKSQLKQSPQKKNKRKRPQISDENQTVSSDLLASLVTDSLMVETGDAWMPSQKKKSSGKKRKPKKCETKRKGRKTKAVSSRGEISELHTLSVEEKPLENIRVKLETDRNPGNGFPSDNGFCETIPLKQETCAQNDDNNYLHNESFSDTFINFSDEDTIFNLSPSLDEDSYVENSENPRNNNFTSEIQLPDFTL